MELKRSAGILLHPTSLPGKYGIGGFGQTARNFVDFLYNSGQSLWQTLPLTPTGFRDSPYQSFSTFAGNTLLICPNELISEGYLHDAPADFDDKRVDFGRVIPYKNALFREAHSNFLNSASKEQKTAFECFKRKNEFWLSDYTLFISAKEYYIRERNDYSKEYDNFYNKAKGYFDKALLDDYYFGGAWVSWPDEILNRDEDALEKLRGILANDINYHEFLQYEFFRQLNALKRYANKKGIKIIGDLPIFIAYDSADCWADREFFNLDENGFPTHVAGVPPDYFSEYGQLWGNPLYDWDALEKDGYKWWINRIVMAAKMSDYVRIDHFRGFDTYWSVPFGEKTAVKGEWLTGPGFKFFDAIMDALGDIPVIAEDLGEMFDSVFELRDRYNLPGMKVLQFAFDDTNENPFLPHNYDNANCVVYSGTHDNDTTIHWYETAGEHARDYARRYLNCDGSNIEWDFIRLAYLSPAAFAIIPLQDTLSLRDGRMNMPGVAEGNWQWRFTEDMLSKNVSDGLLYLAELSARTHKDINEGD